MRSLLITSLVLGACVTSPPSPNRDAGDAGPSPVAVLDSGVTITQTAPNSFVVSPPPKVDAGTTLDAGTPDSGTPHTDGGIILESSSKKVRRPLKK